MLSVSNYCTSLIFEYPKLTAEDNIQPYINSKIEVRQTANAGRGMFSTKKILKNETVAVEKGIVITRDENIIG